MKDMRNQVVLITGATDGLGKQVAHNLAKRSATLLLHGRNQEKGGSTLRAIREASGNEALTYYNADFTSLDSVRNMASAVQTDQGKLDVLVNNAGIGFGSPGSERELSRDGYELRFAVNYLAGFLLTQQLLPLLRNSAPARIVNVASAGQSPIDFDDVMLHRRYSGARAYSQSKLAQILFTLDLADRLDAIEITINALHPATYMDTTMVRQAGIAPVNSIEEGAAAVEHLITSPELDGITGQYFDGTQRTRANAQAYDRKARQQLRELSKRLIAPVPAHK